MPSCVRRHSGNRGCACPGRGWRGKQRHCRGGSSSVHVARKPRTEYPLLPTVSHWHNPQGPWAAVAQAGTLPSSLDTAQLPGHCQRQHSRLAHWHSLCDHICSWGKAGAAAGGGTSLQHPAHPRAQPGAPEGGTGGDCTRGCERKARAEVPPGLGTVNPSAKEAANVA